MLSENDIAHPLSKPALNSCVQMCWELAGRKNQSATVVRVSDYKNMALQLSRWSCCGLFQTRISIQSAGVFEPSHRGKAMEIFQFTWANTKPSTIEDRRTRGIAERFEKPVRYLATTTASAIQGQLGEKKSEIYRRKFCLTSPGSDDFFCNHIQTF